MVKYSFNTPYSVTYVSVLLTILADDLPPNASIHSAHFIYLTPCKTALLNYEFDWKGVTCIFPMFDDFFCPIDDSFILLFAHLVSGKQTS